MLPLQAVTSQKGYSVPGNHYQPLMILSKLERVVWWGPGGGTTVAAAHTASTAAALRRGLRLYGPSLEPKSSVCMYSRARRPRASPRGPGSHHQGWCWHLGQGHLQSTPAHTGPLLTCWRGPTRRHRPRHVPRQGCPSRGDIPRAQPRSWRSARGIGLGLGGDAAVGKRCWKLRCQEPLRHGQTNGPAVDRRGAGCRCPRTCRWGICWAQSGSAAALVMPAPSAAPLLWSCHGSGRGPGGAVGAQERRCDGDGDRERGGHVLEQERGCRQGGREGAAQPLHNHPGGGWPWCSGGCRAARPWWLLPPSGVKLSSWSWGWGPWGLPAPQPCPCAGAVGAALAAMPAPVKRLRLAHPSTARSGNPVGASNRVSLWILLFPLPVRWN